MTHDFDKDFAFSVGDDAHALVRRACFRLIANCCGVSRASPADDRRGVDYWVSLPTGRRGLDLKLRRQDFGARSGGPLDCVIELESHGQSGWLLKPAGADLILFAMMDTHRVALFETAKLRSAVLVNLSRWLASGQARELETRSQRGQSAWTSKAVIIPADLIESAIDRLDGQAAANDGGTE